MENPAKSVGVRVGEVLAGKYRVEGILGAGGMGVVVAAHHLQLDERVALKFLLPEASLNQEAMTRFAREAKAAVKIKSEHVARVIDVGTLETGAPYIVMEFLEGRDLAAWIHERGPLRIEQAIEFVLQASEAIAEAHSLGIVHRDLKPANLFVVRRNDGLDSVKVLDFGISKFAGSAGQHDMAGTRTSVVMGSPYYMSPEQMRSAKDVDPTSDIWALGIILYELLSGRTPFMGDTFPEICIKVSTEPPPPLRQVRPEVPPALQAVVAKCLEKERRNRYRDVAELAFALQPFAPRRAATSIERISGILHGTKDPPPAATAASPQGLVPGTMDPFGRTTHGTGAHAHAKRSGTLAILAVLLLAGAGAGFVLLRRGSLAARAAAPSPEPSASAAASPVSASPAGNGSASDLRSTSPAPRPTPQWDPGVLVIPSADPITENSGASEPPSTPPGTTKHAGPHAPPSAVHGASNASPALAHSGTATATPSPASPSPASPSPPAEAPNALVPAVPVAIPPVPAAAPAPSADCDPPYYFDGNGIRVFKKECMR
jgi:serine/threonine protein kinase